MITEKLIRKKIQLRNKYARKVQKLNKECAKLAELLRQIEELEFSESNKVATSAQSAFLPK